ncbi:MAG TPA: hypothetical protein VKT77_16995 [Chthonomonadaceae bacterium]|nr:hypothetical protein [Chthonomonadaceae bacterium]
MVTISFEDDKVVFDVQASHKLWALKSRIEVPLAHIKQVWTDPDPPMGWLDGLKLMGADLPHYFRAGTFWLHGNWAFFDVRQPEKTIVVELENEHFARLIAEVEDPQAAVALLKARIAHREAGAPRD